MFEQGQGVPKSMIEAARWYQMAAEAGNAAAASHLGRLHETGALGSPNLAAALVWYQRAAAGNDANAQLRLEQMREKLTGQKN
jgi:TPR repeat protein